MLLAAKTDDRPRLQSMIQDTEIPNYENWFTTTFNRESGETWAEAYGRLLAQNENEFQELMVRLARMDGEFVVEKAGAFRKFDLARNPLDGYRADWSAPRVPKNEEVVHIADFFFIEGKFRWDSTVGYFPFQKAKTGTFVPGKLIKRVPPEYPEEARRKSIQGTVILNVILRKDGSVTVQDVADGDPILSPAAIHAVRQWRYEPSLLNGQPIDLETKISVVFKLNL